MNTIAVLDLGTGNLHSVAKAVEYVAADHKVIISNDPQVISSAQRVVLPGQGAIGTWMSQVNEGGLRRVIDDMIATKPVLGICVGMQALFDASEEDNQTSALGLISGQVTRFPDDMRADGFALKVPQMGWNQVQQSQSHTLWKGIEDGARFYYANSYFGRCDNEQNIMATSEYGVEFTAAVAKDNLFAVQFHPEKSQKAGLQLLRNFIDWQP